MRNNLIYHKAFDCRMTFSFILSIESFELIDGNTSRLRSRDVNTLPFLLRQCR